MIDTEEAEEIDNQLNLETDPDLDMDPAKLEKLSKKEIVVSSSINLPFSADVAFSAFADLPRQPSWSSWLHSVSYIENENPEYTECGIPLQETKWVMRWKKARALSFSWKSRVTKFERPNCIEWESTSGLKNLGRITFIETEGPKPRRIMENDMSEEAVASTSKVNTEMILEMKFIAPRIVAGMMRRSDAISSLMEDQMLEPTMTSFRRIVMEDDLGMTLEEE